MVDFEVMEMKSRIAKLRQELEEKLQHDENWLLKLTGSIGDVAKKVLELEKRISKLEKKK